ncbi:cytochrome P450 [Pleurotus eryngii]|uniref:Cytochrome P450 n=1 Tax=Pleurotus eryngii TaxID=5323 RepID=A0A9P6D7Q0_PLEER|nr:cytochrome P450 [Pleurotus eryngii]
MVGALEYALAIGGLAFCVSLATSRRRSPPGNLSLPPVYGPWYLPYPIRGFLAMAKLGMDEDKFLLSLRRDYGPVVHLPWPLNQVFVLDGSLIQKVYGTPSSTLSFTPIRRELHTIAFGSPWKISQGPGLGRMFPVHAKGLTNLRLDAPVERFTRVVRAKVAQLKEQIESSPGKAVEIPIVKWVIDTMFEAATSGLFGEVFCERTSKTGLQKDFNRFDACFALLAAEMIPMALYPFVPPIADGMKGRETMFSCLAQWVEDGLPGLEEGVIRDMAQMGLAEGYTSREVATLLSGDLWALQANAPYIASALLLYILQSDILHQVREEIDALPKQSEGTPDPVVTLKTLSSMPLVTSCVQETVRMNTSSFSIRVVEKDFVLSPSSEGGIFIPAGMRVVCITRVAHLMDDLWGAHPESWIGDRFLAEKEGDALSSKRSREMNGFGGGISICEGRHLATAELKSILTIMLSNLDITPLQHIADPKIPIKAMNANNLWKGLQPSRDLTRPGLGAFQFGASDVMTRITTRKASY